MQARLLAVAVTVAVVMAMPMPQLTAQPTPQLTAQPTPQLTAQSTPQLTAQPTPQVTPQPSTQPRVTLEEAFMNRTSVEAVVDCFIDNTRCDAEQVKIRGDTLDSACACLAPVHGGDFRPCPVVLLAPARSSRGEPAGEARRRGCAPLIATARALPPCLLVLVPAVTFCIARMMLAKTGLLVNGRALVPAQSFSLTTGATACGATSGGVYTRAHLTERAMAAMMNMGRCPATLCTEQQQLEMTRAMELLQEQHKDLWIKLLISMFDLDLP
ncbi:hypothetical protein O3P69_017719 [Scylla paramamosain]|uniref:Uncharacterized protein n=1 Tax=Scylla paramamosain TaxID=85552 RepID=A0AAW0U090_SCYPA